MTTKTHDLKASIEYISVDKLVPYARNSRTHSDAQVAQIAASIKEFGFTNPVLIDGAEAPVGLLCSALDKTDVPKHGGLCDRARGWVCALD